MEWNTNFETGQTRLDAEHRRLLELIGAFDQEIERGTSLESLEEVLRQIRQYSESHFQNEERLMDAIAFPEADAHRELHRMLLAALKDLMQAISFESLPPAELLKFLVTRYIEHICDEDKALGRFLNSLAPEGKAAGAA
ncbi:MAG TPA: hemerythrin family protein [Rhodocyclaceae bacterium]